MSEHCKAFSRAMTIIKLDKEYSDIFELNGNDWKRIYKPLGDTINELEKLRSHNYNITKDHFLTETCYNLAIEKNLFDDVIESPGQCHVRTPCNHSL